MYTGYYTNWLHKTNYITYYKHIPQKFTSNLHRLLHQMIAQN